ncbi:MAG: hypothetical protein LBU27_03780 [Candidatus Peribacteria bacterium]|jgi:hypothetical protein|nr:hypothetical protein [Candidatus Peribacteria bacterium]
MKKLVLFVAIVSLVGSFTSCTSSSTWDLQKPDTQLTYQTPPVYSQEVVEFFQGKEFFLGTEEYLALAAGKRITIVESYHKDESFFPLRNNKIRKEFLLSQKENVLFIEEGTTTCYETSYSQFWVPGMIWLILMFFIGLCKNIRDIWVAHGVTLLVVGCITSFGFTLYEGYGYLTIYLFIMIIVGVILWIAPYIKTR